MKPLWALHLSTLIGLGSWAAVDPLYETMLRASSAADLLAQIGLVRALLVLCLTTLACSTLLVLCTQIIVNHARPLHRSLIQLFTITTVVALWCALASHHESIAWQGKRVRFAYRVNDLEVIAAPLRNQWPEQDGELPRIGPFMAYPFGRPTTLVLLQAPRVADASIYVGTIERCQRGAIRLQLTGSDGGDWVEWHPTDSRPASFTGGLAESHELEAATPIGQGWYLVRYTS